MALSELELEILKTIKESKEVFGEAAELAAKQSIPPDQAERICEELVASGYLESIGTRKKYKLGKEGEKVLKS